jgi:hypothetical protein
MVCSVWLGPRSIPSLLPRYANDAS